VTYLWESCRFLREIKTQKISFWLNSVYCEIIMTQSISKIGSKSSKIDFQIEHVVPKTEINFTIFFATFLKVDEIVIPISEQYLYSTRRGDSLSKRFVLSSPPPTCVLYYGIESKWVIHNFPQHFFINIGRSGRFITQSKKSFFQKKHCFFWSKMCSRRAKTGSITKPW